MQPDAVFKCIQSYNGKTSNRELIVLKEGKEYSRTQVNMSETGSSEGGINVYLHDWSNPVHKQPVMSLQEFNELEGVYLQKVMSL